MLDDGNQARNGGDFGAGCPPALPYKAYNYSTDEEDTDDGDHSQADSFPTSAAAMPPPPPPRSASYGLELRPNQHLGQGGRQALHRSLGDAQDSGNDIRGSKRSLEDGRMYGLVGEWRGPSPGEQWLGSHSSLGLNGDALGSVSPAMDDLDNMLMNQSIQQASGALESGSESGSEGSACVPKAKQPPQVNHQHVCKHAKHTKKAEPELSRFTLAVKHLQRHVVEIDRAVFGITGDVSGTRQEVTALKEAVLALQTDTDTITSTLSHLTEEAISAQQKITLASQEAEKVCKVANTALKEAEKARQEQLRSKKEYESLLDEMKATIKSLKESQHSSHSHDPTVTTSTPLAKKEVTSPKSYDPPFKKEVIPSKSQDPLSIRTPGLKNSIEFKNSGTNFKPTEDCLRSSSPKGNRKSGEFNTKVSETSSTHSESVSKTRETSVKPLSSQSSKQSIGEEVDSSTTSKSFSSQSSKQAIGEGVDRSTTSKSFSSQSSKQAIGEGIDRSTTSKSFSSQSSKQAVGEGVDGSTTSSSVKITLGQVGSITPSACSSAGPPPVSKSSSFTQVSNTQKLPAYQSLFARPSSLMSGLTQRSTLMKSVSFADQKEKERLEKSSEIAMQKENQEKRKKDESYQNSLDRKEKKDSKPHHKEEKKPSYDTNSKERKSKDKKESGSIDRRERKHRHGSKDKRNSLRGSKDEEHMISSLSIEDIPMADDNSNELLDRIGSNDKKGQGLVSKTIALSSSTQTPSNFSLGKSSSSPVVAPSLMTNKPRQMPLSKDHSKGEMCSSNPSTPHAPKPPYPFPQGPSSFSRPTSPSFKGSSTLATVRENQCIESSSLTSLHRPGSTPGPLSRQGSMTTVPENHAVPPPPSRPGVFAISRQNSSPNLPIQRQNSGASIPLQRQHSLGTVREEGRLPRQESLMSVPENRLLVDQTLPLSPSQSMTYFPISPSASASTVSESVRRAARASMELVTGPILAGSSMQEAAATGTLAVLADPEEEPKPTSTSTLKKDHKAKRDVDGVVI